MAVRAPASRARWSSRVASSLQLSSSQRSHAARHGEREPARLLRVGGRAARGTRCSAALRIGTCRGVTVDGQRRQPLKEEIGRPRRPAAGRRPASAAWLTSTTSGAAGEPAGEAGRLEALRDRSCAPASGSTASSSRAALQQERGRVAAAPARRTRSARAGDPRGRAADRRRAPVSRGRRAARGRRRARRLRTWPAPPPARAAHGARGRGSARRRARGRRRRRPGRPRLGPAGRPRQVGGDVARRGRPSPRPGARRAGRDRPRRRSRSANARCARRRSSGGCRAVDRGAHKRMAEAHPGADLEQPGRLRPPRSATPVIHEPLGRAPHQRRIAGGIGRRDDQEPLSVLRQRLGAAARSAARSDRQATQRPANRSRPPAARGESPVAARATPTGCRAPRPGADRRRASSSRPGSPRPGGRAHRHPASPSTTSSGTPGELVARLARDEQQHHRLREQPARHEHQRLRRGPVQPLRIVDHAQKRAILRAPRRAGSRSPGRREADPAPRRRSARTWSLGRRAADREADRAGRAPAAHSWCRAPKASSRSDSTPTARSKVRPDAEAITFSRSAVPAAPRLRPHQQRARPPSGRASSSSPTDHCGNRLSDRAASGEGHRTGKTLPAWKRSRPSASPAAGPHRPVRGLRDRPPPRGVT